MEEIKERGYDLSAHNPNRAEAEVLPHPTELTATLLERLREMMAIVEDLHGMVGDEDENDEQ